MGPDSRGVRGARALAITAAMAGVLGMAAPASAQGSGGKVAAEALFEQGRALVAQGKFAEACPKFADSQRLDPSAGTLLNLASCYEKQGRTATAWATYREAASAANAAGRADYVATAQKHAEALAPRLSRLTATVSKEVDGLRLRRDGVDVARAEWGVPIPIDPGTHTLEASAPGRKTWLSSVEVKAEGGQLTATVPELEAGPTEPAAAPASAPASAPPPAAAAGPAPPAGEAPGSGGTQRVVGLVVGGVGVLGLGASGIFAILAKNRYNQSLTDCQTGNPNACDATGVSRRNDARADGDIATIAFAAGAAALAGGAIVWLTAPGGHAAPASGRLVVSPTPGGAVVQGAW